MGYSKFFRATINQCGVQSENYELKNPASANEFFNFKNGLLSQEASCASVPRPSSGPW